ncbi:MAG: glycosyltransferase family 4 protein [Desulforhopalus sp.]
MQKPTNIPVLYLDNTATFGGAINSLLYLLRALDKSRFTPILVTAQPEEFLHRNFSFLKWRRVRIRLSWIDNRIYKRITGLKFFSSGLPRKFVNRVRSVYWLLFITLPEALRYWRIGRKYKVRLVHLNNIMGSQLAGILAAKMLKVPCIGHLRDFEEVDRVTKLYARLIDYHIAISSAIKENLLNLDVPREKIAVVYDAIDLQDFDDTVSCDHVRRELKLDGVDNVFGIFGRIVPWKGIIEFVQSASLVIQSVPNTIALVIGDCSDGDSGYLRKVEGLIAEYGLNEKIILTGYRTDIPALMKLMDVVVHASSKPEPFGMVLIEAMAMQKPVVATKMGGPLDIIMDSQTGFLVAPDNPPEMADAVKRLLVDKNLASDMGRKGKSRVVDMFTKERYARQVEDVYFKLLKSD